MSRAPRSHPNKTDDEVIGRLIMEKFQHMKLGAKKLLTVLKTREPGIDWPPIATAEKWLKRNGLVRKRRGRRSVPHSEPFMACDGINKVWSVDYKG